MIRKLLLALLLAGALVAPASSTSTLVNGAQMASYISSGTFVNGGACSFSGDLIVNRTTFVSCIDNNGACNAGANADYVLTYADMLACKSEYMSQSLNFSGNTTGTATHTSSTTVTVSSTSYPVTFSAYTESGCVLSAKIGGTTIAATASSTYTGGATGTLVVTVTSISGSCTVSGGIVDYFH